MNHLPRLSILTGAHVALALSLLSTGCDKASTVAVAPVADFTSEDIGWTFQYPSDWSVLSAEEIAELEGRGQESLEQATGEELDMSHRSVLYLKKDQFNSFTSALQPFQQADVPYEEVQKGVFELVAEAYRTSGIDFDHTFGEATVGGLPFKTMQVKLYQKGTKDVLMTQTMYDRLFGGNTSLVLSLNSNNPEDLKALEGILASSSFTVQD